MSEVIEKESTELVALPEKETALTVYSTAGGLDPYLERIKEEIDAFVPDTSTAKGRAAIASMAFKVAKIKTAIEALGKTVSAELKEIPKKVDAERKRTREKLEQWQAEVRKPLTEWEQVEEERQARHNQNVMRLDQYAANASHEIESLTLLEMIGAVETTVVDDSWEEFESEGHRAKEKAIASLRAAIEKRQQYEAEQAELANLRAEAAAREQKEREERIAREAEERARQAAEAKAQAERDAVAKREADAKAAAERRELELKLQAEKAEREKQEAINRAAQEKAAAEERQKQAVEAERRRQAEEIAKQEAEAKAREADRKHKQAILGAAKDAIIKEGFTNDQAVKLVKLIAAGGVPNVRLSY